MAGAKPFRLLAEGEKRLVQEKVKEWEERLARMRAASLRLEGEVGERYRQILKELVVKEQGFLARWEQVRSRLYVAEEEWRGLLEALETLERAYETVRGEVEPVFPSEARGGGSRIRPRCLLDPMAEGKREIAWPEAYATAKLSYLIPPWSKRK